MKIILRLVVLLVVALLIFTGGFWLGNKWKKDGSTPSEETLSAKVPGQEETAPGLETPEGTPSVAKPEAGSPVEQPLSEPTETTKVPEENISAAPPQPTPKAESPSKGPPPEVAGAEKSQPPESAPEKTPKEKPVSEENQVVSSKAPTPSKNSQTPPPAQEKVAASPMAKGGKSTKEQPPTIVTPQDLGENQITYSVQTGAFLDKTLAENQMNLLKEKKYPAFMVSAWDSKRQLWHTVRVGRFIDIMEARMAARTLQQKERIAARVYGLGSLHYEEPPVPATIPEKTPTKPATPKAAGNGVPEPGEISG